MKKVRNMSKAYLGQLLDYFSAPVVSLPCTFCSLLSKVTSHLQPLLYFELITLSFNFIAQQFIVISSLFIIISKQFTSISQ